MAKDVNLYSKEWCNIVFEGKNQEYGAYQIRQTSSKRHIIAFISVIFIAAFVAVLPALITNVKAAIDNMKAEGITDAIQTTVLDDVEIDIPDDFVPPELPPPPIVASIKFTAPEITKSEDMTDDDAMKSQADLIDSKSVVSIIDHIGDNDPNAVDARDLEQVKVIVQEKDDEPVRIAEQMPEFPGGMEELYAYIRRKTDYPQQARENFIQGTVLLEFVVGKDGAVDRVSVKVGTHPLLDKEAIRVVKTLPKWIPAKVNGKPVACWYTIPIAFTIQ
jgi:protein TonB